MKKTVAVERVSLVVRVPPDCKTFLETLADFHCSSMSAVRHAAGANIPHGAIPESWACIDCGINTAPGCSTREQLERLFAADWNNQGVKQTIDDSSEVYMVKPKIWKAAGMDAMGGCLCIACLEKRLGRTLMPKDFMRNHPFSQFPGTERLMARRTASTRIWGGA